MQPYFFPYLGYYALIKHSDHFIIIDTPQFIRHGWIERNRILKPKDGWQYIKVPLEKHSRDTAIKDIKIKNTQNWKKKIFAQLTHYKKKAPFYDNVIDLLKDIFSLDTDSIVELDKYALIKTCEYLGINTPISVFSEMDLKIDEPNAPDEWALNISLAMKADKYINPPGGKEFFDKSKYDKNGIELDFFHLNLDKYNQKRENFESGLSIIDVMMFNSIAFIVEQF